MKAAFSDSQSLSRLTAAAAVFSMPQIATLLLAAILASLPLLDATNNESNIPRPSSGLVNATIVKPPLSAVDGSDWCPQMCRCCNGRMENFCIWYKRASKRALWRLVQNNKNCVFIGSFCNNSIQRERGPEDYKYPETLGWCVSKPSCGANMSVFLLFSALLLDHMLTTVEQELETMMIRRNYSLLGTNLGYVWPLQPAWLEDSLNETACMQAACLNE